MTYRELQRQYERHQLNALEMLSLQFGYIYWLAANEDERWIEEKAIRFRGKHNYLFNGDYKLCTHQRSIADTLLDERVKLQSFGVIWNMVSSFQIWVCS